MIRYFLTALACLLVVDIGTARAQGQCSEDQLIWDICSRQVCDTQNVTVEDWCSSAREVCDTGTAWVTDYCSGTANVCDTGYQWVEEYCPASQWVCDYETMCEGSCDEWGCWEACWNEARNCREETYWYVCGGHDEAYQYNCREESFTYACGEHPETYQYNCREESFQYICGSHEESQSVNCRDEQYACNAHCPAPPPPVQGCTDPNASNYNPNASADDGSCSYPPPSVDITFDSNGVSAASAAGTQWLTVIGDSPLDCRATVATSAPVLVTLTLTLYGPEGGPLTVRRFGASRVTASVRMASIYDNSPNIFECFAEFSVGTESGTRSVNSMSSRFYGSYYHLDHDYESILYFRSPTCDHDGMLFNSVTMPQPAPGFPNINAPPRWMQDAGFKAHGQTYGPIYMHVFGPHDFGQPPCIAAP